MSCVNLQRVYLYSIEEIYQIFSVNPEEGLSQKQVEIQKNKFGKNEVFENKTIAIWPCFIKQFKNFMVLILMAATLVSLLLGEYIDALTIFIILFINAVLGFLQEYKAEQSIKLLKDLASPTGYVIRNGIGQKIDAKDVVPGDILLLEAGDKIVADARLIETKSFEVDESMLTGESITVIKSNDKMQEETTTLGDRKNIVYAGTVAVKGKGKAVVYAIGKKTELGKIAEILQTKQENRTPLEIKLESLGKKIGVWCIGICLVVVLLGVLKGESILLMCMAGISLAVAIIPEGLPAIVTVALALGMQRMIKHRALIRHLPAVETLGCVNVICSDKTGTLTKNEMTVRQIFVDEQHFFVTGDGYNIKGEFISTLRNKETTSNASLHKCLSFSSLCNNSILKHRNVLLTGSWRTKEAGWSVEGDPTEGALVVAAAKLDIWREKLEKKYTRINELPFEAERGKMSVVYQYEHGCFLITKGAPEKLLPLCDYYEANNHVEILTSTYRKKLLNENEKMADEALRVLAIAYKKINLTEVPLIDESIECGMVFIGLIGMIDPPRSEVVQAIDICKKAGIKPIMITGDHPNTAKAIAKSIHMIEEKDSSLLTGGEIEQLSSKDFAEKIKNTNIFARVSPLHKLRIVKELKRTGAVVAMTGDGINDAPAIKAADIGISMGQNGTELTKDVADMILLDNNFATIVTAIQEGRIIYDNIRKFIRYLLACNIGEVLTMLLASLLTLPLPLLPVQILWINLITDGLPALALGIDRSKENVMSYAPRAKHEGIFSRGLGKKIFWKGIQIGVSTILVFSFILYTKHDLELARTVAFTTLVFLQMFHVFDCRSERLNSIEVGLLENKYLVIAVFSSILLHCFVIYLPICQRIFVTEYLSFENWLLILIVSGWEIVLNSIKYILFNFVVRK